MWGKKEDTYTPLDENTELGIGNYEVENSLGKRLKRPREDVMVLDEVSRGRTCLDI